jgi:hypothetical protein
LTPIEVIAKAIQNDSSRLSRGQKRRQAMAEAISQGLSPEGPRAEWLKASALAVLDTLKAQAEDFNTKNPDDKISNQDLADVLVTTLSWMYDVKGDK